MRRPPDAYAVALRAFREMTATTDDAAATRARVLALADRGRRPHVGARRLSAPTIVALLVAGTGAVAGGALAPRWRLPTPRVIEAATLPAPRTAARERRTSRVIPPVASPRLDDLPARPDVEAAAYGRAHRAHFLGGEPGVALAAWDEYLQRYPHGVFEPEARFNRALCLVRLGRAAEAEPALRAFAEGRYGDYRRGEATTLIDWLPRSPPAP